MRIQRYDANCMFMKATPIDPANIMAGKIPCNIYNFFDVVSCYHLLAGYTLAHVSKSGKAGG
ncbi:hypothetical protein YTPLAS21_06850 [Candidatus Nitrosocosmicus sp.]|nr:hypothetical protein YTPLAS21_06850 [Candidatus Nitrosocosmicus sp.]